MDNALTLATILQGLGSFVLALLRGVLAAEQPTLSVAIPAGIGWLVHRYIKSKAVSTVLCDMAGSAYTTMSTQFASGTPVSFSGVRQLAIATAIAGMDTASKLTLAHLSGDAIASAVNGKLGQLLASDPAFSLTDPLSQSALLGAVASRAVPAAAPAVLAAAPAVLAAAQAVSSADQGPPPAAAGPSINLSARPNFDIVQLVQGAVRDEMQAAIHNGMFSR